MISDKQQMTLLSETNKNLTSLIKKKYESNQQKIEASEYEFTNKITSLIGKGINGKEAQEIIKNYYFKSSFNKWQSHITSFEKMKKFKTLERQIKNDEAIIRNFLNMTDDNAMKKFEDVEEKVKSMFRNQDKDWYKDLSKVANHICYYLGEMEVQQELVNRLMTENFTLNGKIESLKSQLKNATKR